MIAGNRFGALRLDALGEFYPAQRAAAEAIIRGVHEVACDAFRRGLHETASRREAERRPDARSSRRTAFFDRRSFERPHHAFVIDGERGNGKTTLLLTLLAFLSGLRLSSSRVLPDPEVDGSVQDDLRAMGLEAPDSAAGSERAALVMPVVFMEDMEATETTMEAVFAQMDLRLDEEIAAHPSPERRKLLEQLGRELRQKVGLPWTFSQRIGAEALSQDALGYADFVERRAELNKAAYSRILTWRDYVERYLDALGYQTLVLLFDDSDLNPILAEDILRAIRMYFSHPRIVSILAVEIDTLGKTVFARNLAGHGAAIDKLVLVEGASDLVEMSEGNARALVDKVLPRNLRYRLATTDLRHLDFFLCPKGSTCGADGSFEAWVQERAAVGPDDARLAWFLLARPYKRLLSGSVRQVVAFGDAMLAPGSDPVEWLSASSTLDDFFDAGKRGPEALVRRVRDDGWRQAWLDPDDASDGAELPEGPRRFVEFRLDLQLARHGLVYLAGSALGQWLAPLAGDGEDSLALDAGKRLGVAGHLRARPLPRSCLYVHQLRFLEPIPTRQSAPRSRWYTWLAFSGVADKTANPFSQVAVMDGFRDHLPDPDARGVQVLSRLRRLALGVLTSPPEAPGFEARAFVLAAALYAVRAGSTDVESFRKALDGVVEGRPAGFGAFLRGLAATFDAAEQARHEALLTWRLALDVATLADRDPADEDAAGHRFPSTAGVRPRLPDLVRATVERLAVGDRHAILLGWSLGPLLPIIHAFGADYAHSPTAAADWRLLQAAFERLVAKHRLPTGILPQSWEFTDIPLPALSDIANSLIETAQGFAGALSPADAAGLERVGKAWPKDPAALVAVLLGTTAEWARANVV